MSLELVKQLIRQYDLRGTAQEIADALNAKTEAIPVDELYTVAGLIQELGPDLTRQIIAKFKAVMEVDPLLGAIYEKLTSTGISFADPLTHAMIDQLVAAGVFDETEAEALKSIGVKHKSKWELVAGDGTVVDVNLVAAALNDNPEISRQVIVNVCRTESGTAITVIIQELHDGFVATGNQQVYVWRSGQQLPADPVVADVISRINQAVAQIEV
jgi:glycine/D-amino acid oxidase-like deaminating enzyme